MRRHRREGIDQRRAVLDFQPLDGVAVVARPSLRHIVEHARVEATAAARAGFEEHVGEGGDQPLEQRVQPQIVAVRNLALPLRVQQRAADLGHVAVEVPFHIGDHARF